MSDEWVRLDGMWGKWAHTWSFASALDSCFTSALFFYCDNVSVYAKHFLLLKLNFMMRYLNYKYREYNRPHKPIIQPIIQIFLRK